MSKRSKYFGLDEPLKLNCHSRPKTRRELISQGFMTGAASVFASPLLSQSANALTTPQSVIDACGISFDGAGKIPFICFDLAGGANIAGSNVLVGGRGGQEDFLDTAGYGKQGLPPGMIPPVADTDENLPDHINRELGLAFHSKSGFLEGIKRRVTAGTMANTNGCVVAARSENDTGNNPHNPMYGINLYGARGSLVPLIGSRSSESGGNSLAPASLINPEARPTKVDRPSDVTGLVDVGDLVGLLSKDEIVAVMETMYRVSDKKLSRSRIANDAALAAKIRQAMPCKYLEAAGLAEQFSNPADLNPLGTDDQVDPDMVAAWGSIDYIRSNREFLKTASVMKMVIDGLAGAGTITMGGYDYHTGDRATGEVRDIRAGECMGACLEYAMRKEKPLMMYVFSDGSVFSNGMLDESTNGGGKGVWTGDSQQTAAAFFLVYNPGSRPQLFLSDQGGDTIERHQQIGYMRPSGDVETSSSPAANNVNQLVQLVMLNYMALHGDQGQFAQLFADNGLVHGLGSTSALDRLIAFQPIVSS